MESLHSNPALCAAICIPHGCRVYQGDCCAADVEYNLKGFTKMDGMFGVFNALGTVAFAYGGHNVILEIQVGSTLLLLIGSPSAATP